MKKISVLMALLLLLSAGFLTWANLWIHQASDQVVFLPATLHGDPAAADGAVVETTVQYDQRLFWNSVSRLEGAAADTETDYRFYSGGRSAIRSRPADGIRFSTDTNFGFPYTGIITHSSDGGASQDTSWSWSYEDTPARLAEYARQLWAASEPGETATLSIPMSEIFATYPLYFSLDVSDGWAPLSWSSEYVSEVPEEQIVPGTSEYIIRAFRQFFQIPVLPEARLELQLYHAATPEDSVLNLGADLSVDFYEPETFSALTDSACFFTFTTHSQEGRLADTSLIPGGYGLYRVPLGSSVEAPVRAEELAMVYPLDPEAEVVFLGTDQSGDRLFLVTREEEAAAVTVIDSGTCETLARFQALPLAAGEALSINFWDDLLLLRGGEQLALAGPAEEGGYTLLLRCRDLPELSYDEIVDCAWDGERLAVVRPLEGSIERYGYASNFLLAVYERDGPAYVGAYISSLQQEGLQGGSWNSHCNLTALTVNWET